MATENEAGDIENKKAHRKPHAGRKAEKKKKKNEHVQELTAKQRNPKAFAINSAVRAERKFRRHEDLNTKKQHTVLVDRTPLEPPPIVVAVVGPPKVGKTTLIRCLIRSFTRQPLTNINGPVTIISGKRRRITLIECNNDINTMIDIAKIADLVFLLIDGSFGFEMEIFEFLNICQVHGMPKIMGILTHLDLLKNNTKVLKQTKKTLKHRFWTEVYPGAKLFYISGMLHGEYMRNEIERLGRFISVMKFRPLLWQTSHSYILADRIEDLTSPELIRQNSKCDRIISLYGYVRGMPLNQNNSIHISGGGDFKISDICFLPDPCPLPDKLKKRSLVDKERLIYAPFSGVGGIVYDKDAVYVELTGNRARKKNTDTPEQEFVSSLVDTKETMDAKLEHCELQLFSDAKPITGNDFVKDNCDKNIEFESIINDDDGRKRRKVIFADSSHNNSVKDKSSNIDAEDNDDVNEDDSDDDDEDCDSNDDYDNEYEDEEEENDDDNEASDGEIDSAIKSDNENNIFSKNVSISDINDEDETALKWKADLSQKAADAFIARQNTTANLWKLVYDYEEKNDKEDKDDENEELADGLFKVLSEKNKKILHEKDTLNAEDCSRFVVSHIRDWSSSKICNSIRDYFVTGKWKSSEDANELLKLDSINDDDELYGDFEDLETGAIVGSEDKMGRSENEKPKKEMTKAELIEKKRKLKEKFDTEYDEKDGDGGGTYYDELKQEASKQAQLNKCQFEGLEDEIRVKLEGYRPGMYVRIEFSEIPCELITNFDPTYPIVIGGLQPGEENIGFVNVRIKKHRWYNKILKTKDPIIISLGWRKFQTLPVYYKLEDNFRQRMLKYTPEHVTCMANFWGPLTKPGTGFLAIQDISSRQEGFRIIATGTVIDANQTTQITKKLKLIGEPLKIFKKTAFIKNMFNSTLEVAKFEGARVKTVSGIRGQIKRACSKPEGAFRATFEDCIKLSDIVFCRTWCGVEVPKLYNPVTSLLLAPNEKTLWRGMKTTGQLKREKGIKNEPQLDSLYTPVVRKKKVFKKIKIPKRLQGQLPYKDKPKTETFGRKNNLKKQRVAVVRDIHEYKVAALMKMLRTNYQAKQRKQKRDMRDHVIQHKRQMKIHEQIKLQKEKERRKKIFIKRTKKDAKK